MACSKPSTVRQGQCGRRFLVAGDDGLQQGGVFADMIAHARQPIQKQAPDSGGVRIQAHEDVLEMGVARGVVDLAMNAHILAQ